MIGYPDSRIAYLHVSHFSGFPHFYGRIEHDGEVYDIERTLTATDAKRFNLIECGGGYTWREGDTTTRFDSTDDVMFAAMRQWRDVFPHAMALVEGRGTDEPQYVIAGLAPEQRVRLNTLFMRCEELGWWATGNRKMVGALADEWERLIDEYLSTSRRQ